MDESTEIAAAVKELVERENLDTALEILEGEER
jgi:hypothetical protein